MTESSLEAKIQLIADHIGADVKELLADAHAALDDQLKHLEGVFKKEAPKVEVAAEAEAAKDADALAADAGKDLTKIAAEDAPKPTA